MLSRERANHLIRWFCRPAFVCLLVLPALLLLLTAQTAKPLTLEQTLRKYRDAKRLILVVAQTAEQPDFKNQKALLVPSAAELTERDVVVLELLYDKLPPADAAFLARQLGGRPAFAAVLIGKDGGVKAKSLRPIMPPRLFETIDAMPMRREEMRRHATP